jgi:hypothetical protein
MPRRSHRRRIVNALDYPRLPMVPPVPDFTTLPEFSTDSVDSYASHRDKEVEPRAVAGFLFSPSVDPWPEIRRRLTVRQFEVFEYVYKMQMSVKDVTGVTGLKNNVVYNVLRAAKRKLRRMSKTGGIGGKSA